MKTDRRDELKTWLDISVELVHIAIRVEDLNRETYFTEYGCAWPGEPDYNVHTRLEELDRHMGRLLDLSTGRVFCFFFFSFFVLVQQSFA